MEPPRMCPPPQMPRENPVENVEVCVEPEGDWYKEDLHYFVDIAEHGSPQNLVKLRMISHGWCGTTQIMYLHNRGAAIDTEISKEVWYHKKAVRSDAEKMLENEPDGTYLIRRYNYLLIMSFRHIGNTYHALVSHPRERSNYRIREMLNVGMSKPWHSDINSNMWKWTLEDRELPPKLSLYMYKIDPRSAAELSFDVPIETASTCPIELKYQFTRRTQSHSLKFLCAEVVMQHSGLDILSLDKLSLPESIRIFLKNYFG